MRPRISIWGFVRPSVRPSVRNAFFSKHLKPLKTPQNSSEHHETPPNSFKTFNLNDSCKMSPKLSQTKCWTHCCTSLFQNKKYSSDWIGRLSEYVFWPKESGFEVKNTKKWPDHGPPRPWMSIMPKSVNFGVFKAVLSVLLAINRLFWSIWCAIGSLMSRKHLLNS